MRWRALSIRQPWAFSITVGTKRVENRKWATSHRGPFLIHASAGLTYDEVDGWNHMIRAEGITWPGLIGQRWRKASFERGGIVGMASVERVVTSRDELPADQHPWFFGPKGFVLTDVRELSLIPCKGALGFFDPGDEVQARVRELLSA